LNWAFFDSVADAEGAGGTRGLMQQRERAMMEGGWNEANRT